MDLLALHSALAGSLSANHDERQAAENALRGLDAVPGYLPCLLHIISSQEVTVQVKQAGMIYFKNLVQKHWEREYSPENKKDEIVFSEADKQSVRNGLLEALIVANHQTRPQIVESLRKIAFVAAAVDFPVRMPEFLDAVVSELDINLLNAQRVLAALIACRALCKVFEYRQAERRLPLNGIISAAFSRIATILELLLTASPEDEQAAEAIKIGVKCFWSCVHQSVPLQLQEPEVFMRWMSIMYRVIERPVPASLSSQANEAVLAKKPFWAAKRWACQILHRIFHKYGNPKTAEKQFGPTRPGEVTISRIFHDELAVRFMNLILQFLSGKASNAFLPERAVVECFNYLSTAVSLAIVWQELKPHVEFLVTQVIFPILCFDETDAELWSDDPSEFIRKSYDVMEDYTSQRVAACSLAIDLCKKRAKSCLVPIVKFCENQIIESTTMSQRHPDNQELAEASASKKDGAMYLLGAIAMQISESEQLYECQDGIENLISNFIAVELESPRGHMRGRACWALGHLVDLMDVSSDQFTGLVHRVMRMFRDEHIAVRFQAAVALRMLIYDQDNRTAYASIRQDVGSVLPQIMEELFVLMDQISSEELVSTLDVLIECFSNQMPPFAQGLCNRLAETFLRFADFDDVENDSSLAASQSCCAIATLLDSVKNCPEVFQQLEATLIPFLLRVLSPDETGGYPYTEYIEDFIEIVTYLTTYTPHASDGLWSLLPPLAQVYLDWADEYLCNINLPLENYISRFPQAFMADEKRPELIFRILTKVLDSRSASDQDVVEANKLAHCLLLHGMSSVDKFVPGIVSLVIRRMQHFPPKRDIVRSELIKTSAACLFVNPRNSLMTVQAHNATALLFQVLALAVCPSSVDVACSCRPGSLLS
ncbi:hypothetical protein GUITHDRAFT_141490 [Guillardia theta CCMP2712]|uniref:Importin N-terminal domain-containing protein n=1 Tax=Guillardia theta (strain CCMP2712) TaxID=905079 RepID=L1J114_GUITC|nr:hypothetical protein GUITHDRAFT_141490 [Guillardia theta CCMP2712]EKX42012.1 hypothetical protein GUITHDRAFT_141490 [Guillardia theta CCMP2712]|eukprot:XP_005828992.1 hypothetical protein GUITHDRAFT_141490 [Guillardia theta CCMP2712]